MTIKTCNAYSASLLILLLAALPTAGHAADTQAGGTQFRRAVPKAVIAVTLPTGTTSCADLAAMDQNQDGKVTANDAAWTKLKLWIDANGDRKVASGELTSLTKFGASALNLSGGCGSYVGSNGATR